MASPHQLLAKPGLEACRISEPSEVQTSAIPVLLSGRNAAIQSYTGSGKTLAYLLPILTLISRRQAEGSRAPGSRARGSKATDGPAAIVVAPSHELAMQIVRVAQSFFDPDQRRRVQQCIGGASTWRQQEALKEHRPWLVVGTPGRLAELSRAGALQTHHTGILVLDEADQLLAPQFSQDVGRLADHVGRGLAAGRQTVLVSATLNPTNLALAATWCRDPVPLLTGQGRTQVPEDDVIGESSSDVGHREATASPAPGWGWGRRAAAASPGSSAGGVGTGLGAPAPALPPGLVHLVAGTAPHHAADTLRRGIHALDAQRALVFMNFQDRLRDVQGKLEARGMPAASLHGELSKQERQATLAAFTAGRFRALLVSDVAARGLDIPDCDAVFNLELPTDASHYAHRAGRTARAGRSGVVVSLVSGGQSYVVQRFGKRLGVDIQPVEFRHGVVERVREDQLAPPRKAAGGGPKAEGTGQAAPLALKATRKTAKKGYRSH
ncbi:hypothetical protein ACKKBF_B34165 [Auxenochlorella protothecoides x Auxenochlorella symbiontica]